ncbi:hypothetical protein EDC96DRAFT_580840 [Choanephora cucurbitarum]|nr:hypothetical protein EDC96DRAFT_580840 [Choanephora cucurbitarum]
MLWKLAFGHYVVILSGTEVIRACNIPAITSEANKLQQETIQLPDQLNQACEARRDCVLRNKIKELKAQ